MSDRTLSPFTPEELDELRSAFRREESQGPVSEHECVDGAEIFDAVNGELSPDRVSELLRQVVACGVCAEAWQLARVLSEEASGSQRAEPSVDVMPTLVSEGASPQASGRPPAWPQWASAAAAVAVVAVGAVLLVEWIQGSDVEPTMRGDADAVLQLESQALVSVEEPRVLWAAIEGAVYDVTVSDGDAVLHTAVGLTEPAFALPAELLTRSSGQELLVRVEALDRAGAPLGHETLRVLVE